MTASGCFFSYVPPGTPRHLAPPHLGVMMVPVWRRRWHEWKARDNHSVWKWYSSSFRRSSFCSVALLALSKRLLTAALFALTGWRELKCRYLSICVCFLKTVTLRVPSSLRVSLVLRKGREPSFSSSMVNLMVGYEIINIPRDFCAYQCASSWVCPHIVAVLKLKNCGIPKGSLAQMWAQNDVLHSHVCFSSLVANTILSA